MYNFFVNKGNIFGLWFSRKLQADAKMGIPAVSPPFFYFTFFHHFPAISDRFQVC